MIEVGIARFTVGVFQDAAWAEKGIAALRAQGFPPDTLSVLAKASPEAEALIARTTGPVEARLTLPGLGPVVGRGLLLAALDGLEHDFASRGLAESVGRIGFQAHDGRLFDALVSRGGILVAICSEARAADALALLASYGGGNAAIGAWTGRV